jgi:hypothetical protein
VRPSHHVRGWRQWEYLLLLLRARKGSERRSLETFDQCRCHAEGVISIDAVAVPLRVELGCVRSMPHLRCAVESSFTGARRLRVGDWMRWQQYYP